MITMSLDLHAESFLKLLAMLNSLIVIKVVVMSFKGRDNKLLKKYTKIQERASNLMNKIFNGESVQGDNDTYIKTKIKSYGDKVNTNFQGNKKPKESAS